MAQLNDVKFDKWWDGLLPICDDKNIVIKDRGKFRFEYDGSTREFVAELIKYMNQHIDFLAQHGAID